MQALVDDTSAMLNVSNAAFVMELSLAQLNKLGLVLSEDADGNRVEVDYKRMRETLKIGDLGFLTRWGQLILIVYFSVSCVASRRPERKILYWQNFLCAIGFHASFINALLYWLAVFK